MEEGEYNKIVNNIEKDGNHEIVNGILYRKNKDKRLRVIKRDELEGVLYMLHDHTTAGHFGKKATYEKVKERYYWKNMKDDVEKYVKTCNACQRREKPKGKHELHPIEVKEPFYQIGIDFVGPLPRTQRGNKYIIVAIDYFTKWPEARAVREATAKETVKFIMEDIICRHGCPKVIVSDRGTHFKNELVEGLTKKFEIRHNFATPYHPKTNGLVERFNKTLCESLAKLGNEKGGWDEKIPQVLFGYRTKKQESTKINPFYLTYGRNARLIMDEITEKITVKDRIEGIIEELPQIRYNAKEEIRKSQEKQKKYHDNKVRFKEKFEIGDKVLYFKAAQDKQHSGKFDEKWKGPYYIHEIISKGSYKIKELDGRVLKTPVNGELLKEYHDRKELSYPRPSTRPEFD
jgi:hypothetical protein